MNLINMSFIGEVASIIDEKVYERWGEVVSTIIIHPEYKDGLIGLEEYSHAIVIFYMDQFKEKTQSWIRKPRGIESLDEKGCFAQRTKYRPNPIGISTVEIVSIEDNVMIVKGLDANNKTPVLDIKPYVSEFDSREDTHSPIWMKELMKDYF
ncbi:tRNA (N6-threonylcarbamoyladenosine(37)-N6)-methyltransferase TrmO [Bacillus sp. S10(2024)]|uniref:tRNA (N6-threonylcarbamoyladenosine(37)-N6)-methyltransferase TrmO n=1 Tax=Bacillus sp. S10(2024) TaxID=3162886 RepID=UPI003D19D43E